MIQNFFVRLDKLNMYMKILDLPLKKEWYNMIDSGIKTEEYRELKPFWANRLLYPVTLGIKEYWEKKKTIYIVAPTAYVENEVLHI